MRTHPIATMIVVAIAACGMAETTAQKREKLEATKREAWAAVERQRGECNAVLVEFPGDTGMAESCMQTLRFTLDTAQKTAAAVDTRLEALDPERSGAIERFLEAGK